MAEGDGGEADRTETFPETPDKRSRKSPRSSQKVLDPWSNFLRKVSRKSEESSRKVGEKFEKNLEGSSRNFGGGGQEILAEEENFQKRARAVDILRPGPSYFSPLTNFSLLENLQGVYPFLVFLTLFLYIRKRFSEIFDIFSVWILISTDLN